MLIEALVSLIHRYFRFNAPVASASMVLTPLLNARERQLVWEAMSSPLTSSQDFVTTSDAACASVWKFRHLRVDRIAQRLFLLENKAYRSIEPRTMNTDIFH